MFTKNDLKTGMFGVMSNGFKFVVVDDILVYSNGEWDRISALNDNLEMTFKKVMKVYNNMNSFDQLDAALESDYRIEYLVYDRERDTKHYYNGKVVCVSHGNSPTNKNYYTIGKIYQFVDGSFKDDEGENLKDWARAFESFEEFNDWSYSEWIEIKE